MSYSQVKADDAPPSLIERQPLTDSPDINDGRIDISVGVHQKHQIFSEGDIITGTAIVKSAVSIYAPCVEVDFIGHVFTHWENPGMGAGVFEGKHAFLTMSCPVEEMTILRADEPLSTAWEFAVPQQLLPTSCSHDADNETKRAHLYLPPSMHSEQSRFNPDNVRIMYGIRVRVNGLFAVEDSDPALLAEKVDEVRVVPSFTGRDDFYPPLETDSYSSYVEQAMEHKAMLSTVNDGVLQAETTGMPSMTLDLAQLHDIPEESRRHRVTSVGLRLAFTPENAKTKPPMPNSLSAKLGVVTCFRTTPSSQPPTLRRNIRCQGFALETIRWPQRDMDSVDWRATDVNGKLVHEAFLVYPIQRADLETLVPTFNSCLVARHYRVSLKLVLRHGSGEYILRLDTPMLVAHSPSASEHS